MSFIFITHSVVIQIKHIHRFVIYESSLFSKFQIKVYYEDGTDELDSITYAKQYDSRDEAQAFIRGLLGNFIIDNN
jgi:hypothetical protein